MKTENKINVVNPFYERVGEQYFARVEREKSANKRDGQEDLSNHNKIQKELNGEEEWQYIYVPSIQVYVASEVSFINKSFDWYELHKEAEKRNSGILTPYEFLEFVKYLKNEYRSKDEADKILEDIFKIDKPYRGEYLDAKFSLKEDGMYMLNNFYFQNGKTSATYDSIKLDSEILKSDFKIDLESLLNTSSMGLPTNKTQNGVIEYSPPEDNRVAGFITGSSGPCLNCRVSQTTENLSYGVRLVKPEGYFPPF